METQTISITETAKLIRAALKASFPGVKFSVTSKMYSGGCSINVSYTDGPARIDVEVITDRYEGASFDGMEDLASYHNSTLNGQVIHFGADYVFVNQHFADETYAAILALLPAGLGQWDNEYSRLLIQAQRDYCRRSFPTPLVTNAPKRISRSA